MQAFDASKGLFHLFFSNNEDVFYTDSYVRTRVGFFLYYSLVSMKYEYLYSLSGDENSLCCLSCLDNISARAFDEKNNNGFIGSLFGSKRQNGFSEGEERFTSGSKTMRLDAAQLEAALGSLVSLMKRKSRVAVIIPIGLFNSLLRFPDIVDELKKINSRNYQENNRHIFVITSSTYVGESLRFFRPSPDGAALGNIFYESGLFPELEPYYHDLFEITGNFYIYDELKRFLGDKAVFRNSLSYESIRRMVTSLALNSGFGEEMSLQRIRAVSAVIFAYYNSPLYRKDHILPLPENRKRSVSAVQEALASERELRAACIKAASEFEGSDDPYKYVCSVYSDCQDAENGIYMSDNTDNADELEMLRRIRRACMARFGQCSPELDRAIALMSKPSADNAVSFSAVSFRKKLIEITCRGITDELSDPCDSGLVDFMLRGLDYYFNYFRTAGILRGDALTAADVSFDFYKNVAYLAEKLARAKTSRAAYAEKLESMSGEDAQSTRQYLEKTDAFIKNLERSIEHAENMMALPSASSEAKTLMTQMKNETKNLRELEAEKEPESRLLN